jgi:hypothetical protein
MPINFKMLTRTVLAKLIHPVLRVREQRQYTASSLEEILASVSENVICDTLQLNIVASCILSSVYERRLKR